MHAVERLTAHEPLERLDAESKLTLGQGALVAETPLSEPLQVGLRRVLGVRR